MAARLLGRMAAGMLFALSVSANEQVPEARAVIKSVDRAVISGELAAKVIKLPFRPGDRFAKGDLLVGLDCDIYQAQKAKVAAEVRAARIKQDNAKELSVLNSIGALDIALAQSEYEQAMAELRIANLNTSRCEIRAPWNGRVMTLMINAHESMRQQQELIEIVGDQQLEAEVVVPAAWLAWLEPGLPMRLRADELAVSAEAKITAISPTVDAVSQTVMLRASLNSNSGLISGMSATAYFDLPATR
ncbi:efflux RND transporter periplasmic adaptor subunit [Stutzerimonas kunmingensis]|uniref:efflux RND transporter periplasmic adaptor subunit n=1 Tax=Stutzerimonas kunmingensis TaxID=1211807 RepID=UPI0028AA58A9|nr:efflux RND transporter periplasmic adaptor subunit [Stutzerimonas kunmingensis]